MAVDGLTGSLLVFVVKGGFSKALVTEYLIVLTFKFDWIKQMKNAKTLITPSREKKCPKLAGNQLGSSLKAVSA